MEMLDANMPMPESFLDESFLDALPGFAPAGRREKAKWKRRVIVLGILFAALAAGGLLAYNTWLAPSEAIVDDGPREYAVSQGDIRISYDADGSVSLPYQFLDAEYSAEILAIRVAKDEAFQKGDILAVLDDTDLRASLETAVTQKQDALDSALDGVKSAENSVSDAYDALTSAKNSLERQKISYQNTINDLDNNDYNKLKEIGNQEATIAQLQWDIEAAERDIETAENELALMEASPDDKDDRDDHDGYSANEIVSKRNSIESKKNNLEAQRRKLASEEENLDHLIKKYASGDTTSVQTALLNLRDAEASVTKAQKNLTRAQENLISARTSADKASVALADAQAEAEANLQKAYITAPCDGTIVAVNLEVGKTANPIAQGSTSSSFFVYKETGANYRATASIPELDIASIFEGQTVEIIIEAWGDDILRGQVESLSRFASTGGNGVVSYEAVVTFSASDPDIRDQMNCTLTFITFEVKDVINIPVDSLYNEYGKTYVDVKAQDGAIEKRLVTTGFSDGSTCEITSGLSARETVLSQTLTKAPSPSSSGNNGDRGGMPDFGGGGGGVIDFGVMRPIG